jgi:LmbE family N-acetylglucosaminyl deacetylase
MEPRFDVIRLVGDERRAGDSLANVSRHWQGDQECFCFVSPHDDDVVLGAGLAIQLAIHEGVPVHVLVVTDGSMGYCSPEEKDSIAAIREQETFDSIVALGVPRENIRFLGFPDCQLGHFAGRRLAAGEPSAIEGYTGLQNSFTYWLRQIRPTQVFVPTMNDLHPDHKVTNEQLQISLFHASGDIWPELGTPLGAVPAIHELAIYCDFPEPPTLRIACDTETFEKKLTAIAAFKSQKQISKLIDNVRNSGPQEYVRTINFRFYQPETYHHLFQDSTVGPQIGR